jgi:hypothetical protein
MGGSGSWPALPNRNSHRIVRRQLLIPFVDGRGMAGVVPRAVERGPRSVSDLEIYRLRGEAVFVVTQIILNDQLQRVIARRNLIELKLAGNDKLLAVCYSRGCYGAAST